MNSASLKHYLANSDLILDAVAEGIYGFDQDGNAVFINPAAERMTGWNSNELLGKNIHQYHHHSHADGSCYPASECKIYGTLIDGISRHVRDEVFWRKDGSSFPVEYSTTPVYQGERIIGAIAVFRDISDQLQSEQALKAALKEVNQLTEQLKAENTYLQDELQLSWSEEGLVGESPAFKNTLTQLKLVAQTDSTVLIQGENGTGKELIARNLHAKSMRADRQLVKVNCAAFSETLLESELFGHEKGAFTGATERRIGRFELANKGTLFLDEIGELSLEAQSKLLRVLQEQEFERVGGNKTIQVDIRIIAATNQDLKKLVSEGRFRMDLFYRLNVFPMFVPPLRERLDDLPRLCSNIIERLNRKLNKRIEAISNASLKALNQYHWPGNIRELQNVLERESILSTGPILKISQPLSDNSQQSTTSLESLASAEKKHIMRVLKHCHWRIGGEQGAADILGLPESTLRSRMKKLSIKRPR